MLRHRFASPLLLAMCGLLGFVLVAGAANWPRFRGPNGTGIADDKDIPVNWTDKDVALEGARCPGAGNSSPIVWGDRLFLQSASPDGKERFLLCLSTADGKELWRQVACRAAGRRRTPKTRWPPPRRPPTASAVYAYFWDGEAVSLHAFDFKGEPALDLRRRPLHQRPRRRRLAHRPRRQGLPAQRPGRGSLGPRHRRQDRQEGLGGEARALPGSGVLLDPVYTESQGRRDGAGGGQHDGHHRLRPSGRGEGLAVSTGRSTAGRCARWLRRCWRKGA